MSSVTLLTSDGDRRVVDRKVAEKSILIKNMLLNLEQNNDDSDEEEQEDIPLHNVRSAVLDNIIKWCEHYKDVNFPDDDDDETKKALPLDPWDKEFLNVDQEMLYEIILAANFLNIKPLLNAGCKCVADMIRNKSPEEIRKTFNIVNDFTPEEEAAIKRENEWAEDR